MDAFFKHTISSGIPKILVADMIMTRRKRCFALVDDQDNIIYWSLEFGDCINILIDKGIDAIQLHTAGGHYHMTLGKI